MKRNIIKDIYDAFEEQTPYDLFNAVCVEHIPGKFTLKDKYDCLTASSLDEEVVYEIEDYKKLDHNFLHCLAHAFCADVLMQEMDEFSHRARTRKTIRSST